MMWPHLVPFERKLCTLVGARVRLVKAVHFTRAPKKYGKIKLLVICFT